MGIFGKIKQAAFSKLRGKDTSETVSDVVGGGLIGMAVGELAEEGEKLLKKEINKRKTRAATKPKSPKGS